VTALAHPATEIPPLPVSVVASLLGLHPRSVRRTANLGTSLRITNREVIGRNPDAILIDPYSLPDDALARYLQSHPEIVASITAKATIEQRQEKFARADVRVRARTIAREKAVVAWRSFLAGGRRSVSQQQGFVDANRETFRVELPDGGDHALSISTRSLKRWTTAYREQGRDGLVDGRNGSHLRGRVRFSEEIKLRAEALYLRYPRRTIAQCYRLLEKEARTRGWEMPHYRAIYNHLSGLAPGLVELYRYPEKRHKQIRPFVIGDYESLQVMEMIESDHHQADVPVNCEMPFCEVSHFPWITVWYDVRSRKVLDVELYVDAPNSRHILDSLHRVWLKHGLNRYCHIDNGADYVRGLGKWGWKHYEVGRRTAKIEECAGFDPESVNRVVGPFGVEAIFSIPGEPQGKGVERWFNTLGVQLYPEFESYRGALGQRSDRAEYLRKHPAELPTLSEFRSAIERDVEEYNARPHRGAGMDGRSPNEVFADQSIRLARQDPDPAALAVAFWHEKVGAQVGRNGIQFHKRTYRLEPAAHARYLLQKVVIRYHEAKPEIVVVCDAMGRFIGVATDVSSSAAAPKGRSPQVAAAIAGRNAFWNEVKSEWEAMHPKMRGRLTDVDAEEYRKLVALREEGQVPAPMMAVAGAEGSVITVVDGHLSPLARQIAAAEERLANPFGLSAADLALASQPNDPAQFVDTDLLRERHARESSLFIHDAGPGSEETAEERQYVTEELSAAALRELKRTRDEAGMCVYDLDCPGRGDFDRDMCFEHYEIVFGAS
jgi:hypothetical protein